MKFVVFLTLAAASLSAEPGITKNGSWIYQFDEDGMGRPRQTIWTYSTNQLNFGFPYQGAQTGRLSLRTVEHGQDIMLSIEHGQFLCGFPGCLVNVRFDEGKIEHFCASRASDGSSTVLFLSNKSAIWSYSDGRWDCSNMFMRASFLPKLHKAKRIRIEAEFFHEGMQTLDFEVDGLK